MSRLLAVNGCRQSPHRLLLALGLGAGVHFSALARLGRDIAGTLMASPADGLSFPLPGREGAVPAPPRN